MESLWIQTKTGQYPVYIGKGLRHRLSELIQGNPTAFFVITDDKVAPHYLDDVMQALEKVSPVYSYTVPAGEPAKSFVVYKTLIDECVRLRLDRGAAIVALGGGVIGDLAGFTAATYLRGIDYIQMPTTLLAHDSSVGGKVGINHEEGKNLIGAFYPPQAVIYDTATLSTLPAREWRSGFVEMIKHAMLDSEMFLSELKERFQDESKLTVENIEPWLAKAIAVKANIVSQDEKEKGLRAVLNLGHTLGHALEKEAGYGSWSHGEAVAVGLLFALKLSEAHYGIQLDTNGIRAWFLKLGLRVRLPEDIDRHRLIQRMYQDKKRKGETLRFILLKKYGQPVIQSLPESVVSKHLEDF